MRDREPGQPVTREGWACAGAEVKRSRTGPKSRTFRCDQPVEGASSRASHGAEAHAHPSHSSDSSDSQPVDRTVLRQRRELLAREEAPGVVDQERLDLLLRHAGVSQRGGDVADEVVDVDLEDDVPHEEGVGDT